MRPVEYPNLPEENHRDPATFPLADLGPEINKQGLDMEFSCGARGAKRRDRRRLDPLVRPHCDYVSDVSADVWQAIPSAQRLREFATRARLREKHPILLDQGGWRLAPLQASCQGHVCDEVH